MIRFFRTIRKSILNDGKSHNLNSPIGKYLLYAIGEIVLVVIGILLALQINNWNEDYQKGKEEILLLQNFDRDITKDIQQLQKNIFTTKKRMEQIDSIFIILTRPNDFPKTDFIRYNSGIIRGDLFEVNRGTFDAGIASGKINVLQTDSLRESIFDYYRNINENLTQDNAYKFLMETIIPDWGTIVIPSQEALAFLGLESTMSPINIKELAQNKKYNTVLAQAYGNHVILIELWQSYLFNASALHQIIEKELEND